MDHLTGWKPLPVILKIIWIFILIGAFFSLFLIASAYSSGMELLGIPLYGLYAVNLEFVLDLVLPVLILVAMMKRYRWTWILGMFYFLFFAVNGLMGFNGLEKKLADAMAQMPELTKVPGMDEASVHNIFYWSMVAGLILGSLFDLAIMILFIVKRKYFSHPQPLPTDTHPETKL